jgi:hypothetical protein
VVVDYDGVPDAVEVTGSEVAVYVTLGRDHLRRVIERGETVADARFRERRTDTRRGADPVGVRVTHDADEVTGG